MHHLVQRRSKATLEDRIAQLLVQSCHAGTPQQAMRVDAAASLKFESPPRVHNVTVRPRVSMQHVLDVGAEADVEVLGRQHWVLCQQTLALGHAHLAVPSAVQVNQRRVNHVKQLGPTAVRGAECDEPRRHWHRHGPGRHHGHQILP